MQPVCAVCGRKIGSSPAREFARSGGTDDWDTMPPEPCLYEGWRPKRVYVCGKETCRQAAREAGYCEVPAAERNGYMTVRTMPKQPGVIAS
jgi:hypothetical protein